MLTWVYPRQVGRLPTIPHWTKSDRQHTDLINFGDSKIHWTLSDTTDWNCWVVTTFPDSAQRGHSDIFWTISDLHSNWIPQVFSCVFDGYYRHCAFRSWCSHPTQPNWWNSSKCLLVPSESVTFLSIRFVLRCHQIIFVDCKEKSFVGWLRFVNRTIPVCALLEKVSRFEKFVLKFFVGWDTSRHRIAYVAEWVKTVVTHDKFRLSSVIFAFVFPFLRCPECFQFCWNFTCEFFRHFHKNVDNAFLFVIQMTYV